MAGGTKEIHFEDHIVKYLTTDENGGVKEYNQVHASEYDKENCIIPTEIISFIKTSQPKAYEAIRKDLGEATDAKIVYYISKSLKTNKTLKTLRSRLKVSGQRLDLVYWQPANDKTLEHGEGYGKNRLSIIRQLAYSKKNNNEIDLGFFINGIPVATAELKNALTSSKCSERSFENSSRRD